MNEYPKNISVNLDKKSPYYFVSFDLPSGRKRKSTRVPITGGIVDGVKVTAKQAKNFAIKKGSLIADEEMRKEEQIGKMISVDVFLLEYVERKAMSVTDSTEVNIRGAIKRFLDYLGDRRSIPIANITKGDAKGFVDSRRDDVRYNSVKKDVGSIRPAFSLAMEMEIISSNPFVGVKIDKDSSSEKMIREAFTIDEIKMLIEKLPENWSRAVRVSYYTFGQRLGDVLDMKWSQIDEFKRIVTLKTQKTGRKMEIPIVENFLSWILKNKGAPDEHICGDLYLETNASYEFGQLIRAYGMGVLNVNNKGKRKIFNSKTFHSIRSTCVTQLQLSGLSAGVTMALVGHDSETVHNHYNRANVDQLRLSAQNSLPAIG